MSSRNSRLITLETAPVIGIMAQYSSHRLPKEETIENIMDTLSAYIKSEGKNKEAHNYLKRSEFIQNIANRLRGVKKSYSIKNINTIFSYMQETREDTLILEESFSLDKNPYDIIDFVDLYLSNTFNTYTDRKLLFARLEEWDHMDRKSLPHHDGYTTCIHALAGIMPQTRSLIISIAGGYAKIMQNEDNRKIVYNDNFTIENQSILFVRHIQDIKYIRKLLIDMTEGTRMDIFSLFQIDPKDIQEWVNQDK